MRRSASLALASYDGENDQEIAACGPFCAICIVQPLGL